MSLLCFNPLIDDFITDCVSQSHVLVVHRCRMLIVAEGHSQVFRKPKSQRIDVEFLACRVNGFFHVTVLLFILFHQQY